MTSSSTHERPSWLPPGQVSTERFPVVGERTSAWDGDLSTWTLTLDGRVDQEQVLTWADWQALPRRERVCDIHCVTGWSRQAVRWHGLPLAELAESCGVQPEARFVSFGADSARDHDTSLAWDVAREDTWLVDSVDGAPLTPEHGAPLRTITPGRYFYKSLKWVRRITWLEDDRLGFWERTSSYHNLGRPWESERYTSGSMNDAQLRRFRDATDFEPYRSRRTVVLAADLGGWRPATRALAGLQLKACDLRGARLDGCDLKGANLTRCDLRDASLQGASLRDADLEGADFRGANLRDVDLRGAALSATRFADSEDGDGACVEGLMWTENPALLESQESYLRRHQPPHDDVTPHS